MLFSKRGSEDPWANQGDHKFVEQVLKRYCKEMLGVISGLSISALLTYLTISEYHFIPGIYGVLKFLDTASGRACIAGFLSKEIKAGFIAGYSLVLRGM